MMLALRIVAIGVVLAAVIDPVFAIRRARPVAVDIRADSPRALEVKDRLIAALGEEAIAASGEAPAAVVLLGDWPADSVLPPGVPVSTAPVPDVPRNVRLVRVSAPAAVLPGQSAVISATVEGVGLAGQTSRVVLEQNGIQLARLDHQWTPDRSQFRAEFRYAPPESGLLVLRVASRPLSGEVTPDDNAADVAVNVVARALRIVTYEPRPSWMLTFVRRTLEADPAFAVSALVRSSRGLTIRSGEPPAALAAAALRTFDAVLVGAPEDLTRADIDELNAFARIRGGAVVFLPDRAPRGSVAGMLPAGAFDEVLLEQPVPIQSEDLSVFASELILPTGLRAGATPLATVTEAGRTKPVIVSWPWGAGRVVFSGAIDAWRFRGRKEQEFARFWTGTIASLATAAPPAVSVRVTPAAAAPGDRVQISAAVRPTELARHAGDLDVPSIEAAMIASDGSAQMIRIWPAAAPGVFEATVRPRRAGRHVIRVTTGAGTTDAPFIVRDDVRHATERADDVLGLIAAATGGVSTPASNLAPLVAHIRALPRPEVATELGPMRSVWWIPVLTGVLCAEWALRRRAGLR